MVSDVGAADHVSDEIAQASADLREVARTLQASIEAPDGEAATPLTLEALATMLLTVTRELIELNKDTAAVRIARAPKLTGS